jgi:hypothetical protein
MLAGSGDSRTGELIGPADPYQLGHRRIGQIPFQDPSRNIPIGNPFSTNQLPPWSGASVTNGHPSNVRVFGEMVSELRGKDLIATARLEELWNDVIRDHAVSLLCTYALHRAEDRLPEVLEQLHSQSIEREP